MIKRDKHIKAFTVQELLIGLVISSIVIGMVYTIYVQFNKKLIMYGKDQSEIMEFNQFRQVFAKDICFAKDFSVEDNELRIDFFDAVYVYKFLDNKIIRTRNTVEDVFKISGSKVFFKNYKEFKMVSVSLKLLNENVTLVENKKMPIDVRLNELFVNEY